MIARTGEAYHRVNLEVLQEAYELFRCFYIINLTYTFQIYLAHPADSNLCSQLNV